MARLVLDDSPTIMQPSHFTALPDDAILDIEFLYTLEVQQRLVDHGPILRMHGRPA